MTAPREHLVVYAFGTPIDLVQGPNWIDHRRSRSLAYGLAADLVCAVCGCRLCDDNAHSPRCDA